MKALKQFESLLKGAVNNVYHYVGSGSGDYTTWYEWNVRRIMADNKQAIKVYQIQVNHYTKKEYTKAKAKIDKMLNDNGIPYRYDVLIESEPGKVVWINHIWDTEYFYPIPNEPEADPEPDPEPEVVEDGS